MSKIHNLRMLSCIMGAAMVSMFTAVDGHAKCKMSGDKDVAVTVGQDSTGSPVALAVPYVVCADVHGPFNSDRHVHWKISNSNVNGTVVVGIANFKVKDSGTAKDPCKYNPDPPRVTVPVGGNAQDIRCTLNKKKTNGTNSDYVAYYLYDLTISVNGSAPVRLKLMTLDAKAYDPEMDVQEP